MFVPMGIRAEKRRELGNVVPKPSCSFCMSDGYTYFYNIILACTDGRGLGAEKRRNKLEEAIWKENIYVEEENFSSF